MEFVWYYYVPHWLSGAESLQDCYRAKHVVHCSWPIFPSEICVQEQKRAKCTGNIITHFFPGTENSCAFLNKKKSGHKCPSTLHYHSVSPSRNETVQCVQVTSSHVFSKKWERFVSFLNQKMWAQVSAHQQCTVTVSHLQGTKLCNVYRRHHCTSFPGSEKSCFFKQKTTDNVRARKRTSTLHCHSVSPSRNETVQCVQATSLYIFPWKWEKLFVFLSKKNNRQCART